MICDKELHKPHVRTGRPPVGVRLINGAPRCTAEGAPVKAGANPREAEEEISRRNIIMLFPGSRLWVVTHEYHYDQASQSVSISVSIDVAGGFKNPENGKIKEIIKGQ